MKAVVLSLVVMICAAGLSAAVTLGSTRDEVVAAYGQPKGVTQAGSREILIYAGGRVILEDGQVVRLDMKAAPAASPAPSAPAPAVAPATPAPAPRVATPVPAVEWLTDFEAAKAEAASKKKRILALFTGSDWCPACIDFEAGVAHNADFLRVTQVSFVLLKLDYPRNTPQAPALQRQNATLLRQYGIRAYPSLLVISADGEKSLRVDTQRGRPAADIADYFIQAVDEARKNFDQPKTWW
jgi:thiol-disulfide isomerase/thioredoxin